MSVRTYIGARYVPYFAGTYSAVTAYEALTVVDDGAGTTYIAKVPTPPGTPLNDTDYWAVYGASSGAIISLQNRMNTAEGNITSLQAFDAQSNTIKNRRVITLSDSYGDYVSPGWNDLFPTYAKIAVDDYYADPQSGASFARPSTKFIDIITNIHDNVVDDADSITDIIVAAGYNDATFLYGGGSQSDLEAAIGAFCAYCRTNFPNAQVYIGFIGWWNKITGNSTTDDVFNATQSYKKCVDYGAIYLNGVEKILLDNNLLDIGGSPFHPNNAGMIALAEGIVEAWRSGSVRPYHKAKEITNWSINTGWTGMSQNYVNLSEIISDGMIGLVNCKTPGSDDLQFRGTLGNIPQETPYLLFENNDPLFGSFDLCGSCMAAMLVNGVAKYTLLTWRYTQGKFYITPPETYNSVTLLRVLNICAYTDMYR